MNSEIETSEDTLTRVLICDDHPVALEGAAAAVRRESDLELVDAVRNGEEAWNAIESVQPDVALVDLTMPDLDGLQIVQGVIEKELPTRVVLLFGTADTDRVYEAVIGGATGCVSKSEPLDVVLEAIRCAVLGHTFVSPAMSEVLVKQLRERAGGKRALLTEREIEILRLIAEGRGTAEIARELFVSQSTVKNHLRHIYDKLRVSTAAAAVSGAMRLGLLR